MSWFRLLLVFCLLCGTSRVTFSQEPLPHTRTPRSITGTRLVIVFSELEKQLLQAVQKKDKAALANLLTEDCSVELPDADPVGGEDWATAVLAKDYDLKSFKVNHMSVADLGDSAVVKFDRVQQAVWKGKPDSGSFFVVDIWKKDGDYWKLSNRYVAKVSSTVPTMAPVRPTGKH